MKRLLIIGSHTFTVDAMRFAMQHTTGISLFGVMDGNAEISPALREANPDVVVVDGLSEGNCALESLPEIRREAGDALVLLAVADDEVADTARSGRARRGRVHVANPGRAELGAPGGVRRGPLPPAAGGGRGRRTSAGPQPAHNS